MCQTPTEMSQMRIQMCRIYVQRMTLNPKYLLHKFNRKQICYSALSHSITMMLTNRKSSGTSMIY